ncbi:MAG TPA: tetratricopeptide repeat protein, partial [Xanthobacteraceae bacterium]|nr:tetratricopeptide repeat protein [Xanthobacteraceae bacterium]
MKRTLLVLAALLAVSAASSATADELARLNAKIISDPGNIELNLAYARAAEARGDYGKALAAYERVAAMDPGNA